MERKLADYHDHSKMIAVLHKRHRWTRRQRTSHGADRYSVQFFAKEGGMLAADYDLPKYADETPVRRK